MGGFALILLCAVTLESDPGLAGSDGKRTAEPAKEVRLYIPSGTRSFVPRFQRGFMLWRHPKTPAGPDITIRNMEGGQALELKVEVPETRETYPQSVSPLPGQRGFVVAAATWNLNGTRSSWLLFYSPKGEFLSRKKITPFYVGELTVAEDGTIWAFGLPGKAQQPDSPEPTLLQFSPDGFVLRSLMPRNAFGGEEPPCDGGVPGYGRCEIQAAKGRVVAYAPRAEVVIEWLEEEETVKAYRVARPMGRSGAAAGISGLAVTDLGEILASADGIIFRLDRGSQRWIPVAEEELPARTWRLFGASGDSVLVNGDSSDPFHFRLVPWAPRREAAQTDQGR